MRKLPYNHDFRLLYIIASIAILVTAFIIFGINKPYKFSQSKNFLGGASDIDVRAIDEQEELVYPNDISNLQSAIDSLNPIFCDKIQSSSTFVSKDACLVLLAQKTRDKELCNKVESVDIRISCNEQLNK